MPVSPTYPGVYIEELPSGVRTITGVSTSVAAFIGKTKRGPVGKAVRVLGYADYERRFGGLASGSETSYAVRQFFLNGGAEAWIVRIAKNALAASTQPPLQNDVPEDVLTLTALEQGTAGNGIEVRVDHAAGNPASNFNLTLELTSLDNPSDARVERFENLSMNPEDPRFAPTVVNGVSRLVTADKVHDGTGLSAGVSLGGELTEDVDALLDASHNRFRIVVDGGDPQSVVLDPVADTVGATTAAKLDTLCAAIQAATTGLTCARDGDRIEITSASSAETSSVRVLPGLTNDAAGRLKLGTLSGGTETDAAAAMRPVGMPDAGSLRSGAVVAGDLDPVGPTEHRLQISLDGLPPETVSVGTGAVAAGPVADRRAAIAARIQTAVRAAKAGHPAFDAFTATVAGTALVLASGTRGTGSSVVISAAASEDVAVRLNLTASEGATATAGADVFLTGGHEEDFTDSEAYGLFIGSRAAREGIYALEGVDLFNLLCLPGITDTGILMDSDAYCRERRAFLIVDAPRDATTPADMETVALGSALPKSDHAAVYYPWIRIADPLKGGQLRTSAPCGTVAGLYARTDAGRGIWKAPAGTEANLTGVQALEYKLNDRENGVLNPRGVNCLRNFPVIGNVAWGARTLRGANELASEWKYVPVRRLALYIEESLYRGTQWVVFEPNDEPLWAQVRLNIGGFMQTLFRQGAFQGATPREAYLVKCDRETTTQDDIDRGVVNILVGFAPLKPAEFVIIQIQQLAGQNRT